MFSKAIRSIWFSAASGFSGAAALFFARRAEIARSVDPATAAGAADNDSDGVMELILHE
jgi:hypothetical protein